jgi:signal transduction histidine kinase
MPLVESVLAPLRDSQLAAKLAAQATSPSPAWLWSTDGSRIVWANAVGAAVFGAADAGECERRRFGAKDAAAAQIVRLAATLPTSGQPRLERLRGFGADFGRALTCMCSRVALADGTPAVLIIATEPAGPPLTLGERVRRLFADRRRALAAFAREGTLLYATEPALTRFVGTATLSTLGVDSVAAPALVNGSARGATPYGPVTVERLGSDASTVLVLLFDARAGESVAEPTGAETRTPASAPAPASSRAEPPPSAPFERAAVAPVPVIAAAAPTASLTPEPLAVAPAPAAPTPPHTDVAAATQSGDAAPEQSAGAPELASPSAQAPAAAPLPPAAAEARANGAAAAEPTAAPEPPSAPVQNAAASPPAARAEVPANGAETAEPAASIPQPNSAHAHAHAADAQIERRHPLRFVWQMDADGRFAIGSDEFIELMGPRTTASFGRLWSEIAAELNLDPDQQVARAVATHETWSSITLSWPVDESRERLAVELSGLPVFDRNRNFRGYRGFGVLRDITRTNQLARVRRERPMGFGAQPEAPVDAARAIASPAVEHAAPADTQAAAPAPAVFAAPEPPVATASAPSAAAPVPSEIAPRAEPRAAEAAAANVVPFRAGAPTDAKAPSLSVVERKAFRELAQELSARLGSGSEIEESEDAADALAAEEQKTPAGAAEAQAASPDQSATPSAVAAPAAEAAPSEPVAASAPGIAPSADLAQAPRANAAPRSDDVEAVQQPATPAFEPVLLDRLPVGVLLYQDATLLYANRRFLEWSGHESLGALAAAGGLNTLFAAPGAAALAPTGAAQSLSLTTASGERMAVEGRLFTVPWGDGSALALVLTSAEIEQERRAIAAALDSAEGQIRDLKARLQSLDKTEDELRTAKREAHKAASEKADFLAKVSHEIRTPLNAITGFAEVIMAERFGPIGNERYRDYLKDIHVAGTHLVSLLNDLLDLSKIETGQLDLAFVQVGLNEITQQCVGIMQPQASRARIIIRTSLTPALPQIMADERSLRQIVLNLLANSIKFTGPGGQVIVSTACADSGEIVLRVRDTGVGMSAKDVEAAMEPFRQTATSGSWGSGGNGFGLPLTKALAEANRAHFNIKSAPNAGTLVEIAFPRPTAP